MTNQERIIVTAYTGILMCEMSDLLGYADKALGRTVYLPELKEQSIRDQLKEASKNDFLTLCNGGFLDEDRTQSFGENSLEEPE